MPVLETDVVIDDIVITVILDNGFVQTSNLTCSIHRHSFYEIHAVVSGIYRLEVPQSNDCIEVPPQTMILLPPDVYHYSHDSEHPESLVRFALMFRQKETPSHSQLWEKIHRILSDEAAPFMMLQLPEAISVLSRLHDEMTHERIGRKTMIQSLLSDFFVLLFRGLLNSENIIPKPNQPTSRDPSLPDSSEIREIHMERLFDRYYPVPGFTEERMAEELNLSVRQVNRLLRRYCHMTFPQKLKNCRLNHACQLLTSTELRVSDIAYRVGYQSEAAFYVAFREQYAVTPAVYRKRNPNRSQNFSNRTFCPLT